MVCYKYLNEGEWVLGYTYYTPEVVVSVLKPDGTGQVNFKMETDSGAAISLLPNSAGILLGIDVASGLPVGLGGVGGATFMCYVHELTVVIDGKEMVLPIAFGETDDFPPLLGRLGLYDKANVWMDNLGAKATCVGEVGGVLSAPGGPQGFLDISIPFEAILVVGGLFLLVMLVK